MKRSLLLLLFFVHAVTCLHGQYYTNQNKVWAFGYHAGVDFTSGSPVAITTSISQTEGCASVASPSGSLLFYTDGKYVYNASGGLMPHGNPVFGYTVASTTQPAVIVPMPGNSNQYYLFSLEQYGSTGFCHLAYSIVDMTLDGGNGDVMTSYAAISMGTAFSERMTAVAGNNCDVWLLTHRKDSAVFWAYNISIAGIGSPVISNVGSFTGANCYTIGDLKASPDRQKVVCQVYTVGSAHGTELYDFNATTGAVSNCQVLNNTSSWYGAEFSPDNTKLYVNSWATNIIQQYDISLSTTSAIIASLATAASMTGAVWSELKLGPDNKIYISNAQGSSGIYYLDCITAPNNPASSCGFSSHAVTLATSTHANYGLPNIVISVSPNDTILTHHDTVGCLSTSGITLAPRDSGCISCGYMWYDGTTTTRTKTVTIAGTYWVRIYNGCHLIVDTIHLTTYPMVGAITGTASACVGGSSTLSDTTAGGIWSSTSTGIATIGSLTGIVAAVSTGTVTVKYTASTGCIVSRVFTVNPLPGPITGTLTACSGSYTLLAATPGGGMWTSGSSTVASVGSSTGWVTGVSAGTAGITYTLPTGCTATTTVTIQPLPADITGGAAICVGNTSTLSSATPGGTWSSGTPGIVTVGSLTGVITGVATGTAFVTYSMPTGCYKTILVTVNPLPFPITGLTDVCMGSTITLFPFPGGGTWTSGSTSVATIGPVSGILTGIATGVSVISYTLPTGCMTTTTITVNPIPSTITGSMNLCVGSLSPLSDATPGGTWSSSAPFVLYVDAGTGMLTGISTGSVIISYTLPSGCTTVAIVTVNPAPTPITGLSAVCVGGTATLYDGVSGGTWSSSSPALGTIDPVTGAYTGISAGTATMTYSMGAGCTATFVITVYPLPLPITGMASVCEGATTILSDAVTGGTWMSVSPTVATVGSLTGIVTGVSSGTALISYSIGTGVTCGITRTVTVNPLPLPITGTLNVCPGTTSLLSDAVTGGTWTSGAITTATIGSTTGILTGVTAGTATITYTLPTGCSRTATVTVNPLPTTILGPSVVCAGTTIILTDGTPGGVWSRSNTNVTIGSTTGVVTGVTGGTTTITYTLPTGCFTTKTVTINTSPGTISGTASVCIGSTTTLSDATPGGTWTSGSTGIATVVSSSGVVTGLAAGTAVITYSIGVGCTTSTIVTVNPLPAVIGGPSSVCVGATITLTDATTGGMWSASGSAGTVGVLTGVVTGISAGVATISYSSAGGCYRTTSVTVNPLPATPGGPSAVCVGATITLTGAGGGTWLSSSPGTAIIGSLTGVVSGITTGTTTITYTLPTGCRTTTTVTVSVSPTAITGTATVCTGATTGLSDAVPGGYWITSSTGTATVGSSSGVVTGVTAGTVTITYSLGSGCTVTRTMTVLPSPAPIAGSTVICAGATTTLSDATPGGTWSSSSTGTATISSSSGTVTGVATGTAMITYLVGTTGCTAVTAVTVNPVPVAIAGPATVCVGATVTETDATAGGTWSSTGTASVNSATGAVTGIAAGTATITYTIGGTGGCRVTRTITVNPISPITGITGICIGATTTLSDATPGGTWISGTTGVGTITGSGIVTGITAGTTIITYTLPTGCSATTMVTVNTGPLAITGTAAVCIGGTTTLSDATGGGSWISGSTGIATIGSGTGVVTGMATGTATITYSLGAGCIATRVVTVNPGPAAITGTATACVGATTTLADATPGGTWTSGSTGMATITSGGIVTGVSAGTAAITYTLGTGCFATRTVTISAGPGAITGTASVCATSTTILGTGTPGGTWTSSSTGIATINSTGTVTGVSAGTATITYTLGTGCMVTRIVTVNPLPSPITGITSLCAGSTTTLTSGTSGGIWVSSSIGIATIGSTTGVVATITTGTTTITYTLPTGCAATRTVTVTPPPSAITGSLQVCLTGTTTLANAVSGGVWSSTNPVIATIGSGTGIVSGASTGTTTIVYSLGTGCTVTAVVTVNPLPAAITGPTGGWVCMGGTATLHDATTGGIWSSGTPTIATVGSSTGVVTGMGGGLATISYTVLATGCSATYTMSVVAVPPITGLHAMCAWGDTLTVHDANITGLYSSTLATVLNLGSGNGRINTNAPGTATITYTLPSGCTTTSSFTVNPLPVAMTGTMHVCVGATTTLHEITTGGVWSSGAAGIATVGSTGIVTGITTGIARITYMLPTTCKIDTPVRVDPPPAPITAMSGTVIVGSTNLFTDATPGGTWSSASPAVASVGSSGIVTGVTLGTATISYTVSLTGCAATRMVTVVPLGSTHPDEHIGIYPNPNAGTFTIKGIIGTWVSPMEQTREGEEEVYIQVTDMPGRELYRKQTMIHNGQINEQVTLPENLASGMYLLTLRTGNGVRVFHVMVQR